MGKVIFALGLFFILLYFSSSIVSGLSATVSVPEKYHEVYAGERIFFETDIKWPENTVRQDLRIEYSIRDKDGNEVAFLKVLKAVETQASFIDYVVLPENLNSGVYRIYVKIGDYAKLSEEIGASFSVVGKKEDLFKTYLLIIGVVVVLIAILVIWELFILLRKRH